jgi:hypothetical protein
LKLQKQTFQRHSSISYSKRNKYVLNKKKRKENNKDRKEEKHIITKKILKVPA